MATGSDTRVQSFPLLPLRMRPLGQSLALIAMYPRSGLSLKPGGVLAIINPKGGRQLA